MNNDIKNIKSDKNLINIDFINSEIIILSKKQKSPISNLLSNNSYEKYLLTKNLDNFISKIIYSKNKYIKNIVYINKLIISGREIKLNYTRQNDKNIQNITKLFLYIIKNNINNKKNLLNQKFFRLLLLMVYCNILPIENFTLIINIFLNSSINIIVKEEKIIDNNALFKKSPIYFINDLFKALISIPRKLINDDKHIKLIDQLITVLEDNIFNYPLNLRCNKLQVWLKLLGNKILEHKNKYFSYSKIISFLVKVYKYNFQNFYLYKNIYEKSAVSFDHFINSLDFLLALYIEEQNHILNDEFIIKNGFYIYNNLPLTLNNIQFKTNFFSLIFSFRLTKINNVKEDTIILNLVNNNKKIILKFLVSKSEKILKIFDSNAEWKTNVGIDLNTDYLLCLTQEKKNIGKRIHLYINNNKKNLITQDQVEYQHLISNLIEMPEFYQPLTLELGKSNFEGIIGDVLIMNKKINSKNIHHLYNLKEDYSEVISSINYRYDLNYKKKKYTNENQDIIFFNSLKYQCELKILTKEINEFLPDQYSIPIKPYGELKYSKNNTTTKNSINDNNNNINIRTYNSIYSIKNFLYLHGFEYLIFQLHKIKSLSENNENLNFYLYKLLYFVLEYIKMAENYIFPKKDDKKFKIELKFYNFFLSLFTILNTKKRDIELDEKIREILLDFSTMFQKKKTILLQKINFTILFDNKLFRTNKIINYNRLFDEAIWYFNNNENDNSLLLFYKVILLDDFFLISSKETKHKRYMQILCIFLTENRKPKIKSLINDIFLQYFIDIKNPKKKYHYLKIIFYGIQSLKNYYKEKSNFINYIFTNYNKLDDYNNKYCCNTQILCFLLYDIIINSNQKNEIFSYTPYGFMKMPTYNFIRCIFIQCFNINNNKKLKFIKSSLHYDNEFDLLQNILKIDNLNVLSLIDFENFIPKLDGIIKYYCFLYNEYLIGRSMYILKLLKKSIKLILDFLDKVIKTNDYNNYYINTNSTTSTISEESERIILINNFINDLFTCSCIKLLFILYFHIFKEHELKDLKNIEKYMLFSINRVYNPFYFYLLLPFVDLNNDSSLSKSYKSEIIKMIITNIILINNTIKVKLLNNSNISNRILILNSIIILIRLYNIIFFNETSVLMSKTENSVILYLKYIMENGFLYSKYAFNINLIDENVTIKKKQNKINEKVKKKKIINEKEIKTYKFLCEIILDVIFHFLDKKEDSELLLLLYKNLKIKENTSVFYEIDDYFLSELNYDKNQTLYINNIIQLLNTSKIGTNYCSIFNSNSILYSVYFLIYFLYKQKNILNDLNNKSDNKNENSITLLINRALEVFFNDCISIFNKHLKKIKKQNSKFSSDELIFKIYHVIFDYFSSKCKDSKFKFSDGREIYTHFFQFLNTSKVMHKIGKNEHKKSVNSDFSNPLNKSELSISFKQYGVRKSSFMIDDYLLLKINERETVNSNYLSENILFFKRSLSDDIGASTNKFNNILEKDIEDNSSSENFNNYKIKTPNLPIKESKKQFEVENLAAISSNLNNIDQNSETNSESSFYENNNLNYNSDYNCNNYINFSEDKQRKRKNAFYLNNKNFKSAIILNENLLSSKNLLYEPDISEFSLNEEMPLKNKLSQDDSHIIANVLMPDIIEEEDLTSSQNNINDSHKYILDKLKDNDIPYFYYRDLASKEEPKWSRIVLNPKREIMRIFGFIFGKYIYYNKKFIKLKNSFYIEFKDKVLESSIPDDKNYTLNYPTQLRNFTCDDYYRPFLKPVLNYFESEYFFKSHQFLKKRIVQKDFCEEDQLGKIDYERIHLFIKKKKTEFRIKCENISNKGSIFGSLHLNNSLMVFQDNSSRDHRLTKETKQNKLFYLFSSDVLDRLKNKDKYIIIYYNEIKEIILRRFCFIDIAYEIFMKDNRSYFFNFYNVENRIKFYNGLKNKINDLNSKIKEKDDNKNSNNLVDILFINEPKNYFEKKNIQSDYVKNEISNFQYLLLVNKFSTRTYNDTNQYLIFPLLYMDKNKKIERDLSKAICLNKKLSQDDYLRYENNYESMGYHFNIHYTTMAYIVYYLVRINPFTDCQIKLQSGHFDSPSRIFSSIDNLLLVYRTSDENRELCPEFFYSYESFLNLNYNDIGYVLTEKKQIHNLNTSQNCGIVEFIIDLRNILETKELDQWINNIFGYKQTNFSLKSYNSYPNYSYEQFNNFTKEKEEIEKKNFNDKKFKNGIKNIRNKIEILSMGVTPSQLFKSPHPNKEIDPKKKINSQGHFIKKKSKIYDNNNYLKEYIINDNFKNLLYIFNSFNSKGDLKIIFSFDNQLKLFNYLSNDKDKPEINIDFDKEIKILNIKPYRNLFIELYDGIYLICRLSNGTLLLCSEKQKYYIEWPCLVTSIEYYFHSKSVTNSNAEIHANKILIGDEDGYLSIIEITTEYNDKKKEFKINSLNNNLKKNKAHYSYINGIYFCVRLNVIISSCGKGYITINNAYSFDIINIIKIGNNLSIFDFKVSKYDLLYIYTNQNNDNDNDVGNGGKYGLYCYTLNGVKISKLNFEKEIINFYIHNSSVYIISKNCDIYEYNCANFKQIEDQIKKEEINNIKHNGNVLHCVCCSKLPQLFIIFNNKYENIHIYSNY